jgi:opacity protein-like surface antigen
MFFSNAPKTLCFTRDFLMAGIADEIHNATSLYLMGGLGVALNTADHFATNIPSYLTITPYYPGHLTSAFSYIAGAGLDFSVSSALHVGLGYRFTDIGRVSLAEGRIRNQALFGGLKQSHLYFNAVAIELNWLF